MKIDSTIPVAYAMNSSPKRYALLLGAGISIAADYPSGRQIATKIILEIAKAKGKDGEIEGEQKYEECIKWFDDEYNETATFDKLLNKLIDERIIQKELRSEGLRPFIYQTDEDGNIISKQTTEAHEIIAELVKNNIVSLIITTNFDNLLENTIENKTGIHPVVIKADSDPALMSIFPDKCRIIKINGDFQDLKLKITPEDLDKYEPEIKDYIIRICSEYGLVVCGWSADYDIGLRKMISFDNVHRYPTFWCLRPDGKIPDDDTLKANLKPIPIEIESADQFFTDIQTVINRMHSIDKTQPLTVSIATKKVTDALQKPKPELILSQLIHNQTDIVLDELAKEKYVPIGTVHAPEIFIQRTNSLTEKTKPLAAMLATIAYYDDSYYELVYDVIERLINIRFSNPYVGVNNLELTGMVSKKKFGENLYNLRHIPALIVIYSCGIAATKGNQFNTLGALFSPKLNKSNSGTRSPYFETVNISNITSIDFCVYINKPFFGKIGYFYTFIYETCRSILNELIPSDSRYQEYYDVFEYLLGIAYLSTTNREPIKIREDLEWRKVSPLYSKLYHGIGATSPPEPFPDYIQPYFANIGGKIEGTNFFNGDPEKFERFKRKIEEIFEIQSLDTGIEYHEGRIL
ncbi:hypothetical protein F1737_01460 [Methanoplanus sp. FWC-SCC4]|uniref:SIR2-like domain-containing protein n=1 Tax=Methanochimaera problematica TaxID=2609417 RepID=A0AA97FBZ0_9EURY|nr:SIR2 family protein [Methanoplanus sp. FWC-SCC4]WOF15438.1 hypothetical protein F1737_01460 [Methanoplanus sp. FWC-SCC4]